MKNKFPFFVIALITVIFFHKTFVNGFVPFPGDLLISEYQPWKSYSYLGYNPGSYPSKKQYFDTIRQIYPWRTFVNQELKQGRIPLWNPHNFSGHPLMANLQSQVFYPLTLLYFVTSQPISWTILIILQPFLATAGMFLYLTTQKRSTLSSLLGSVAYGFSQFMTVFLEYNTIGHVIVWLPFLLYSVEKKKELLFVFSLVSCALAGHLQIFGAILVFQLLYAFFITHSCKRFFFLTVISLGIASIQLIPTVELLQYSARSNHEYHDLINRLLIQPKQLLTFLNPDLFGNPATGNYLLHDSYPGKALFFGSIMFFFALAGIFYTKKERVITFFTVSALALLLLITKNPFTQLLYRLPIPLLSQSAPGNFLFLITFFGAALSAYGIDLWVKNEKTKVPFVIITLFTLLIWTGFFTNIIPMNRSMIIFTTLSYAAISGLLYISRFFLRKIVLIIMILMTIGELFYFFQKFNPFVPNAFVYPETSIEKYIKTLNPHRFYGYGGANIQANFATQLGLYDPNGYDPLYPKDYGAFIYSSKNGTFPSSFDRSIRSDATIAEGFGSTSFNTNTYRKSMLNLLGVRYIINNEENGTTEETFPPSSYPAIYKQDGFIIHENVEAQPKAFFLEATASALITVYEPSYVSIEVKTPITQKLFLSDTYMPGWKAFINDSLTPIVKAHTTFREIEVPEGEHTITFVYDPYSFYIGIRLSLISFVALLIYLFWKKIRYKDYAK